jgi:hypothetical protein
VRLLVVLALLAAVVSGCSGTGGGTATVWVTRDHGAHVLLVRRVPAGLTALQGLARVAHVKTRYAGRYVQAIDGVEGSLTAQRDWFYFVNGYEADRSAAEYRLRRGDVEWWDYRSWKSDVHEPVVIGAFPEPFLHGYGGKRRPSVVVYDQASLAPIARRLARVIHSTSVVANGTTLMGDVNILEVTRGRPGVWVAADGSGNPGDAVRIVVSGIGARLAAHPGLLRYRYAVLP